jgi:TolB-like protein/tetratricopeptide (TPR) repeat protein
VGHFLGGVAGFLEFAHTSALGRLLGVGHPASAAHGESTAPPLSVAILPFTTPSRSDTDLQFTDALTQDLTTSIAGWRWASVAAYGLAAGYRGKPVDARAVGRDLNVRYLFAGETRTVGETLVISANLIEASNGTQVWTDSFEFAARRLRDQPPVPHLLLAKRLRSGLLSAEKRRVKAAPDGDSPMEATLRGLVAEDDATDAMQGIRAAREIYAKVLQRNPDFVPAMWRYVGVLNGEWIENPSPDRDRLAQEMDVWSSRAIKVDPLDFEAWRARAWTLQVLGRWDEALAASDRALALFPAGVGSVLDRAFTLNYAGRPEQALPVAELARTMDPQEPAAYHFLCKILIYLGRYGDAVAACEKAAALENGWFNQFYLAAAYANAGDLAKAAVARDALLRQQSGFTIQRYRDMFRSSPPAFFALVDLHIAPALRKVGLPDR